MWDITNILHADTTSSLCPMGLRGQTDKAKQTPTSGSGIGSDTICDVPHRIGEEVPGAIYVEAPLNQVDAF